MDKPISETGKQQETGRSGETANEVCARLRAQIVQGKIAPGSVLTQTGLAKDLQVSRTPVREAMRMLHQERLLEIEPNNRARVRGFRGDDIVAVYSQRMLLESLAIAITMPKATAEDHDALNACIAKMSSDECREDFEKWLEPHREFHRLLVHRCGDGLLRTIERLSDDCLSYQYLVFNTNLSPAWWANRNSGHVELVAAFASGKTGWASRLLAQHYAQAAWIILGEISDDPEADAKQISTALDYAVSGAAGLAALTDERRENSQLLKNTGT